jgi:CPA2 family monovalent cation:H+ antiporter-2
VEEFPFDVGDVVVFLAAAGLLAPLLARFRVSPVLTFLLLGVFVGPYGLGRLAGEAPWLGVLAIDNVETAEALAAVGVVLLLFLIGLEVSLKRLRGMRRLVVGLGGLQVGITTAGFAVVAGALGAPPAAAFVVGAALALSSTAIVLELLSERGQLGSDTGQATLSTLLAQDLAVVPILITIAILGRGEEPAAIGVSLALAAGGGVIAIAGILAAGRIAAAPFLRAVAGRRSPEMFAAAVLLLIVLTGAATQAVGLSIALGAFLAGLMLAETEYRHEIEAMLAPFKGLLIGLFFLSIGMRLDLARALAEPLFLGAALAGMIAVKAVVIVTLARVLRTPWPAAVETGLLLAGGGEFAFIVLTAARGAGVIELELAQSLSLVAGASMAITPLGAVVARRMAAAVERRSGDGRPPERGASSLQGHVLIIGYGRVGRMLGELLSESGVATVALDRDAKLVAERRARGEAVYFADANRVEVLGRLGADAAAALVVTLDSAPAVEAVVRAAHRAWPKLPIYARARDSAHAAALAALGAQRVTPEALEASLELAEAVLGGVGVGASAAQAIVGARRRAELDRIGRPEREDG